VLRAAPALLLMAAPAAADFVPPAGCTTWLTVQQRSCMVSNHFRCDHDAPGDQWREDAGINGPFFVGRIDAETQWMESHNPDGTVDVLAPGARDPASFSELIATGRDTYSFTTVNSTGFSETFTGFDALPGQSVVIDGVPLERTTYKIEARFGDGSFSYASRGAQFIHRDWRLFFSGTGDSDFGDGNGLLPYDFTPVEFHFPGDPGFGDRIPKFDCDDMTAQAPQTHDAIRVRAAVLQQGDAR
jgi:hypothetical protein